MKNADWNAPDTTPQVEDRGMREFIVAVYRQHSGKIYSFAASYLNGYPLNYRHGCPKKDTDEFCEGCEDGCPTTGWFTQVGEEDDGATFQTLGLQPGDKMMGWRTLPQWEH